MFVKFAERDRETPSLPYSLTGKTAKSLDKFGRTVIPESIRAALVPQLEPIAMVPWFDRSIGLLNTKQFEVLTAAISSDSTRRFHEERLRLTRVFGGLSQRVPIDAQGKVTLPENLKKWAGIKSDIIILGTIDMAEIWAAELYQEKMGDDSAGFDDALRDAILVRPSVVEAHNPQGNDQHTADTTQNRDPE